MSHAENVIRRVLHITMIFTAVLAVLVILSCAAFADTNSAPEWMPGALKEDSQTVTLGNPYTPKQSITAKWTDPDGDKLTFLWWQQPEIGKAKATVNPSNQSIATIQIPSEVTSDTIHIICEVHDEGPFHLVSYRRIIFEICK